jgi:uncharacterized protein (TIGR01777 family)
MSKPKMIIAGGTGFLGSALIKYFRDTYQIYVLTRGISCVKDSIRYLHWDGRTLAEWTQAIDGSDILINLNGKSVDCRYTEENKKLIYSTRLDATSVLGDAIQQATVPPRVWINAASATIYRHSLDKEMDEYSGEIGSGFSVDVCLKWEAAFNKTETPNTRKVIIRTGIVFGKEGGPLKPLKTLAQLGLGGRHGTGDQFFSWLHEDDFVRIVEFLLKNENASGVYNVTSPSPIPNESVMKSLRKGIKVPFGLPQPKWLLEFGARLIGTETELILKSRRVVPRRLLREGYKFNYDNIATAMQDLLSKD